jgi:hypothetical protein
MRSQPLLSREKRLRAPSEQRSIAVKCHLNGAGCWLTSARQQVGSGAHMKCLACSAEMRLTEVRPDERGGIERHTFRCSACAHMAKRLMLNRSRVPTTNLPTVIPPKAPVIDPHNGRPAAQSAWAKSPCFSQACLQIRCPSRKTNLARPPNQSGSWESCETGYPRSYLGHLNEQSEAH